MLVAERRRRQNISDKVGHDNQSYELPGESSPISGGGSPSQQLQYAGHQYPSGPIRNSSFAAGRLLDRAGTVPPPIVPSLAPPTSLPPIPPSQHYPKPPVLLNSASSGIAYGSLGHSRQPLPPPLPHLMTNIQYTMPPSNLAISSSLPGRAARPSVQRPPPRPIPQPVPPPGAYAGMEEMPQRIRSYTNPSGLYGRGIRVPSGGGNSSGAAGALNWSNTAPVVGGGGSAVGAATAAAAPMVGGGGSMAFENRSRFLAPAIPAGYVLDPSSLPPAGKSTHRYAMPSYFAPSGMPTPATSPRVRGKSGLFYT